MSPIETILVCLAAEQAIGNIILLMIWGKLL